MIHFIQSRKACLTNEDKVGLVLWGFLLVLKPVSQFLQGLILFLSERSKRGDANGSKTRQKAEKPLFFLNKFFPLASACIHQYEGSPHKQNEKTHQGQKTDKTFLVYKHRAYK